MNGQRNFALEGGPILALDTSSKAASAAVTREGRLLGEIFTNTGLTHSQTMLPMVRSLLGHCGVKLAEIAAFAVSVGPGSFTGLRIGVAAVKGLALPFNKPCVPVSTLEALAMKLTAFEGVIVPVMDARRAQLYTALFRCEGGILTRLRPDAALSLDELRARLAEVGEPAMIVGDGAAICAEALPGLRLAAESLRYQRASGVAAAAALCPPEKWLRPEDLAPIYIRLPQAERELLRKQGS